MKQSVNLSQFRQAFADHGRANQFSYEALEMLYDFFEQVEIDGGEGYDLDVIGICCEYTELNPSAIVYDYEIELTEDYSVNDYLEDNTFIVGTTKSGKIVFCSDF